MKMNDTTTVCIFIQVYRILNLVHFRRFLSIMFTKSSTFISWSPDMCCGDRWYSSAYPSVRMNSDNCFMKLLILHVLTCFITSDSTNNLSCFPVITSHVWMWTLMIMFWCHKPEHFRVSYFCSLASINLW